MYRRFWVYVCVSCVAVARFLRVPLPVRGYSATLKYYEAHETEPKCARCGDEVFLVRDDGTRVQCDCGKIF